MNKVGSTTIQWTDYNGFVHLSTTSRKLVESLAAAGIVPQSKDYFAGTCTYRFPTAWLRLRVPKYGLLRLGWYPTKEQKGLYALFEDAPQLNVIESPPAKNSRKQRKSAKNSEEFASDL